MKIMRVSTLEEVEQLRGELLGHAEKQPNMLISNVQIFIQEIEDQQNINNPFIIFFSRIGFFLTKGLNMISSESFRFVYIFYLTYHTVLTVLRKIVTKFKKTLEVVLKNIKKGF